MTVVSFPRAPTEPAYGDNSFLVCPCQAEAETPAGHIPVVIHDASGAFVASLVCSACNAEVHLNGGRLEQEEA